MPPALGGPTLPVRDGGICTDIVVVRYSGSERKRAAWYHFDLPEVRMLK